MKRLVLRDHKVILEYMNTNASVCVDCFYLKKKSRFGDLFENYLTEDQQMYFYELRKLILKKI